MYSTIMTSMLSGIATIPVRVEVDISSGMPSFDMVGFLSSEVREAKERVRTALHNCGVSLPPKRITVNLSPGNIKKSGTGFDLAIAVALLIAMEMIPEHAAEEMIFIGELNLRGELLPVSGVLPIVSDRSEQGFRRFAVPADNINEAMLVKTAEVLGFETLDEVVEYLKHGSYEAPKSQEAEAMKEMPQVDFSEVSGQSYLRRAAEVAAAGMHNMLIVGPPGAGKTMISERVATILPDLTEQEQLELSKIYSVCGMLGRRSRLMAERPFRSPHHTISRVGLTGGGHYPRPGEISLAHHGVLFLDELTEFDKTTVEMLRQPLEDHRIQISRASGSVSYPADFLLLAAMNPCNCGFYPDMQKCRCTPHMLQRYIGRISKPLIDRIDLCVQAPSVSYQELRAVGEEENSATIRSRVQRCHDLQRQRYREENFEHNSQIPANRLLDYCGLQQREETYMEQMYVKMDMTARTYHKVLRVARTIADLEGSEWVKLAHLQEAVCYRSIGESFWGGICHV